MKRTPEGNPRDTSEEGEFQPVPGLPGRLFVPRRHGAKKHPCRECFACQHCPDARCAACLGRCGECPTGEEDPRG